MNSDDFRQEIHSYLDSAYDHFIASRNTIKDIFGVFHNTCVENNIIYYCAFGTLIGIVRDNGMIPWDADIDVAIPVSEARETIRVLSEKLPKDYYIISNFIDKNYYLCESRVCKRGLDPEVFHVDIFYLLGTPNNEKKRQKFCQKIRKAFFMRTLRNQPIVKGEKRKERAVYYIKKILKFFLHLIPGFIFNKIYESMFFRYSLEQSEYYAAWTAFGHYYPASCYESINKVNIDGQEYMLPSDPDGILKAIYHNYKEYLPIERRFDEMLSSIRRFERYSH